MTQLTGAVDVLPLLLVCFHGVIAKFCPLSHITTSVSTTIGSLGSCLTIKMDYGSIQVNT